MFLSHQKPGEPIMESVVFRLGSWFGFLPFTNVKNSGDNYLAFRCFSPQCFHFAIVTVFWHAVWFYQASICFKEFDMR